MVAPCMAPTSHAGGQRGTQRGSPGREPTSSAPPRIQPCHRYESVCIARRASSSSPCPPANSMRWMAHTGPRGRRGVAHSKAASVSRAEECDGAFGGCATSAIPPHGGESRQTWARMCTAATRRRRQSRCAPRRRKCLHYALPSPPCWGQDRLQSQSPQDQQGLAGSRSHRRQQRRRRTRHAQAPCAISPAEALATASGVTEYHASGSSILMPSSYLEKRCRR